MYVRALFCGCRRRLGAEDEAALRALVRERLAAEHAAVAPATEERAAEIVGASAYDPKRAGPYAGADDGAEEDFEPGPAGYSTRRALS
jgi:hypothetical protein